MRRELAHLTDRELLEEIYILLIKVYQDESDDGKVFAMNLIADLIGTKIENYHDQKRNNN